MPRWGKGIIELCFLQWSIVGRLFFKMFFLVRILWYHTCTDHIIVQKWKNVGVGRARKCINFMFHTLTEELENLCSILYTPDVCEQPKTVGPCHGNFSRWYYDQELRMCQEFGFGGCHGNRNNFLTESECQHQCLQPGRSRGKC